MNLRKWFVSGLIVALLGMWPFCQAQDQGTEAKERRNMTTARLAGESSSHPPGGHSKKATEKLGSGRELAKDTSTNSVEPEGYTIGPEDEVQVSVWREPELSIIGTVRPDGMISLPLLNDVPVVGLKPLELQAVLTEKLKAFVNEPQVTVIVRVIRSRKVYVLGQVGRQGAYPLQGRKAVLELIAEAGGLGAFAKAKSIYILRDVNGRQVRIAFNYKNALAGKSGAEDIELLPGDKIVVP